jgi:type I restriction enzyme S subunit
LAMELPRGWAVQSFENLFLFIDYRGNTAPKTDEGIPLITAKNIRMGYTESRANTFLSQRSRLG